MKYLSYYVLCLCLIPISAAHANRVQPTVKTNHPLMPRAYTTDPTHFVQFFSSESSIKAEGMKNTLENQGYPAFVKISKHKKQPYYQVQVGPFVSKAIAQKAKRKVIGQYPQFAFLSQAIIKECP